MLTWNKIRGRERVIRAVLGMKEKEVHRIQNAFSRSWKEQEAARHALQERQRKVGGGRTATLAGVMDKLIFILVYIKVYPTQDVQGVLFGMSQSTVCDWVHRLLPVLEKALQKEFVLPARAHVSCLEELKEKYPELEFIIDGTERPIQRPKNSEKQKKNYSGKKKRHSIKNTIVIEKKGKRIVILGDTKPGSTHDKKMADEDELAVPEGSTVLQDSGYQGYTMPGASTTHQPKKKPRGGELTEDEKAKNRQISRERIGVEHAIGGTKVYRIVADTYRGRKEGADDKVILITSGLYNFRRELVLQEAA